VLLSLLPSPSPHPHLALALALVLALVVSALVLAVPFVLALTVVLALPLARALPSLTLGLAVFGLGYLPPSGSPLRTSPLLPPNTPPMAGSLMILRASSLDDAWERIRSDVYWTEGVWDRGQVKVEEFIRHAEYNDME
jgi:hypothetical protein